MTPIEELLEQLRHFADSDLPEFTRIARTAFAEVSPVFQRPRYAEFFFHCAGSIPGYLARVVLANADAESDGSKKLFLLWKGSARNPDISRDVMIHSKDESRHSRLFVTLTELTFPQLFTHTSLRRKQRGLFRITDDLTRQGPDTIPEEHLMDHLIQMNMGEIRTRTHMLLLSPVIYKLAPESNRKRVGRILDGLVTDEIRHITYTARFIEAWCSEGRASRISAIYRKRLKDFHQVTVRQTESSVTAYGRGRFPDLLEI